MKKICFLFILLLSLIAVGCSNIQPSLVNDEETLTQPSNNDIEKTLPSAHTCIYNQQVVSDDYKASDPTCVSGTKYYYSCSCGEKGTTTFEYGNALGHIYTNYIYDNNATCSANGTETATCDRCAATNTRTKNNTKLSHNYNSSWSVNGAYHWHECSNCGNKIDSAEHIFDQTNKCSTCQSYLSNISVASFDISKNSDNSIKQFVIQYPDSSYSVYLVGEGEMKNYNQATAPLFNKSYANNVKKIVIDGRIQSLGSYVFEGCSNIKDITVPNGIVEVGDGAFKDCASLTTITLPNSVSRIGLGTFSGCSSLKTITLPFVGGSAYASSASNTTRFGYIFGTSQWSFYTNSQRVGENLVDYYYIPKSLTTVTITNGSIYEKSFVGCQFSSITLLDDVSYIGASAFESCVHIQSFTIPQGINAIENSTFYDCWALKSITIPDSVVSIGSSAFNSCGFKNIVIPEGVKTIGYKAFNNCTSLISITLPNTLTDVNDYAFDGCTAIENVSAPAFAISTFPKARLKAASVTSGEVLDGFSGAQQLENILLCDSITSVNDGAFDSCNLLRYNTKNNLNYLGSEINPYLIAMCPTSRSASSFTIDETCKVIYGQCFTNCINLKSIVIPNNIISVGQGTFMGCSSLESIELPFIGASSYLGANDVQYSFGYIFGTTSFSGAVSTQQYNRIPQGNSYGINSTKYYIPSSLKVVSVSGENIPYGAFYNCTNITNIYIGDNVKDIDGRAFTGCSSLQFNVKNNIKYLGNTGNPYMIALGGTTASITEIVIENNCKFIAFAAFPHYSLVERVVIPDSVEKIGEQAFRECSALQSVIIGSGVKYIGLLVFSQCTKLKSVEMSNQQGWKTSNGTTISEEALSTPASAASCLTSTYTSYEWFCD